MQNTVNKATVATPAIAAQAQAENIARIHEQAENNAIAAEKAAADAQANAEKAQALKAKPDAKLAAIIKANAAEKAATEKAEKARAVELLAAKAANVTPRAIAIETHDKAGYTGRLYTGNSATRNAGVTKAADTTTSKATRRTFAQLTPRMQSALTELARAYGTKPFPIIGIDRGQCAIFINSEFFVDVTETKAKLSAETFKRFGPSK